MDMYAHDNKYQNNNINNNLESVAQYYGYLEINKEFTLSIIGVSELYRLKLKLPCGFTQQVEIFRTVAMRDIQVLQHWL